MAQFPTEPPTSTPSAKAPPEILPPAWLGPHAPPLEIDVGCHKGLFLAGMAARHPSHNFLGIERQPDRVAKARKKIHSAALPNASVVQGGGLETLRQLPAACAAWIHVLFPDPWPKRRHHIRRLVQAEFLRESGRVLQPRGCLRLVTDDPGYAAAMRVTVEQSSRFEPFLDEREYPLTEFQKKFLADARPVHAVLLRRAS